MTRVRPEDTPAFKELIAAVRRGSVVPFVGAGLSWDYGFPMWGQFLAGEATGTDIADRVETALHQGAYEEAAEIVDRKLVAKGIAGGIGERVKAVFGRDVTLPEKVTVASLLPGLTLGPIITTNFDRVLESIYARIGSPLFPLWGAKARLALEAPSPHIPLILKLHGDAKHQDDRVLLLAEYERHYGNANGHRFDDSRPLPAALKRLFLSDTVLFLGCSLSEDRTMAVLAALAQQSSHRHFAFLSAEADQAAEASRTAWLASRGITPIYYERNNHGEVKRLLEILVTSRHGNMSPATDLPDGAMDDFAAFEKAKTHAIALLQKHADLRPGTEEHWTSYVAIKDQVDELLPSADAIAFHLGVADAFTQTDGARAISAHIGAFGLAERIGDREASRDILANALQLEAPADPFLSVMEVLHAQAGQAAGDGDLRAAARHSIAALRLAQRSSMEPSGGLVRMLSRLARTLFMSGRRKWARRLLAYALYVAYTSELDDEVALLMNRQVGWHIERDEPRRAIGLAKLGLAYARGDALGTKATLLADLGTACIWIERLDEARDALWRAWWYERIGTNVVWHEIVTHVENLAWLYWRQFQEWEKSTEPNASSMRRIALEWSIDLYDQGIQIGEAEDLKKRYSLIVQQALPLAASGKVLEAMKALRNALMVSRRERLPWTATGLNNCGLIWDRLGAKHRARYWYTRALQRAIADDDVVLRPTIEENLRFAEMAWNAVHVDDREEPLTAW